MFHVTYPQSLDYVIVAILAWRSDLRESLRRDFWDRDISGPGSQPPATGPFFTPTDRWRLDFSS